MAPLPEDEPSAQHRPPGRAAGRGTPSAAGAALRRRLSPGWVGGRGTLLAVGVTPAELPRRPWAPPRRAPPAAAAAAEGGRPPETLLGVRRGDPLGHGHGPWVAAGHPSGQTRASCVPTRRRHLRGRVCVLWRRRAARQLPSRSMVEARTLPMHLRHRGRAGRPCAAWAPAAKSLMPATLSTGAPGKRRHRHARGHRRTRCNSCNARLGVQVMACGSWAAANSSPPRRRRRRTAARPRCSP